MIRSKNLQISNNGSEPQLLNIHFGISKNIKSGNHGNYPYFTALELNHLDNNRQAELEQTNVGAGIKKTVKRVIKKESNKVKKEAKAKIVKEIKTQAQNQVDNLIGHITSNNEGLAGGKIHIRKALKKAHVGRKLKNVGKNVVLPVAKEAAKTALKDGALALVESNPELMPLLPVANAAIDKGIGSGVKPKKINPRAVIVKKVMKQHDLSMIDASKFVKANNLYNKK